MTVTAGASPPAAQGMNNPLDAFQDANRSGHILSNVSTGNGIVTNMAGTQRKYATLGNSRYEPNASFGSAITSGANINFLITGSVSDEIQNMLLRTVIGNSGTTGAAPIRVHRLNNILNVRGVDIGAESKTVQYIIPVGDYTVAGIQDVMENLFITFAEQDRAVIPALPVQSIFDDFSLTSSTGTATSVTYNGSTGIFAGAAGYTNTPLYLSGPFTALLNADVEQTVIDLSLVLATVTGYIVASQENCVILHTGLLSQLEDKLRGSSSDHTFQTIAIQYLIYRAYNRGQVENAAPLVGFNELENSDPDADPNYPKWGMAKPFLDNIQTKINYDCPLVIKEGVVKELILPIPTLLAQGLCKVKSGKIQPQIQIKFNREDCLARNSFQSTSVLQLQEVDLYASGMELDQVGRQKAAAYFNANSTMIPVYIDQFLQKPVDLSDGNFTQVQLPHMGRFKEMSIQLNKKIQNYSGVAGQNDYARVRGVYPGLAGVSGDEIFSWGGISEYTLLDNSGSPVGLTQLDQIVSQYLAVIAHDFTDYINATKQTLLRFSVGWNDSWYNHAEDGGLWFEPTFSLRFRTDSDTFDGFNDGTVAVGAGGVVAGTPGVPFPGSYYCTFFGVKHAVVVQEKGYSNIYLQQ